MSYYALKDVDWPWDDETEGRAIVVRADTPEEAVRIATAKHLAEYPGAGGVTWDVSRLHLVAFGDASWEEDNQPHFEDLTYYFEADLKGALDLANQYEDERDELSTIVSSHRTALDIAIRERDELQGALRVLSEVHLRDDDVSGFVIMMGATPEWTPHQNYAEAWETVWKYLRRARLASSNREGGE